MSRASRGAGSQVLVVRTASRGAALPLAMVRETMRPLPVEPLPGMPPFVAGLSVVRAEPVPVVDLGVLLDGARSGDTGRFVAVRSNVSTFVVAVREVVGIRELPVDALQELPLLLGADAASVALAITGHDERLVTLLNVARLVPLEVWQAMPVHGAAS